MNLIEVKTVLRKGGIIKIPTEELNAMKLKEGDEICLVYLEHLAVNIEKGHKRESSTKEFLLEKQS